MRRRDRLRGWITNPWAFILALIGIVGTVVTVLAVPTEYLWVRKLIAYVFGYGAAVWVLIRFGLWLAPARPDLSAIADAFVTELHLRLFPMAAAMDPNYRVSLFTPVAKDGTRHWQCIARTDGKADRAATWPEVPKKMRAQGGLVSRVASEMAVTYVEGVPLSGRNNPDEVKRYLEQSCLSVGGQQERSWQWASLVVSFARNTEGNISCVIVVEREDGKPIVPTTSVLDNEGHDFCMWNVEFAAELWRTLKG